MLFGGKAIKLQLLGAMALALTVAGAFSVKSAYSDTDMNVPAASQSLPADPAAVIARGKYLVDAADCMPCHSGPNHAPYSGGLVLNTPFGGLAFLVGWVALVFAASTMDRRYSDAGLDPG